MGELARQAFAIPVTPSVTPGPAVIAATPIARMPHVWLALRRDGALVRFDVARGADGRWWVVSQRTQSPSGLGYVLHNRLTIARQFPDAFRELRVQHIASSYRRLLDTVQQQRAHRSNHSAPKGFHLEGNWHHGTH